MQSYTASPSRYKSMEYRRCGNSGLLLPAISLGLWHNFGGVDDQKNYRKILRYAFDNGITHFDLANNYGPPPGSAEENFGYLFKKDFCCYRDELIITTKAGYNMWEGPYGEWGSKKYLVSSLDQSLKRMKVDYVDIFYSHRYDPNTPLEETMGALDLIVRQGKALYAGISNYRNEEAAKAIQLLKQLGTPCLIHQPKYSMFERWIEDGLLAILEKEGVGCISYSPLAQGLLTSKYLHGIPTDSRAANPNGFLQENQVTEETIHKISALHILAKERGQTLAQMALSWILKDKRITSVLIGVSKIEQLIDCLQSYGNVYFSNDELQRIEEILSNSSSGRA